MGSRKYLDRLNHIPRSVKKALARIEASEKAHEASKNPVDVATTGRSPGGAVSEANVVPCFKGPFEGDMITIDSYAADLSTSNPEPETIHKLFHEWNLSADIQAQLDTYTLRKLYAPQIAESLRHHQGLLSFQGNKYVPIYQNCSRFEIGMIANNPYPADKPFWVSFRKGFGLTIAVIQPEH